MYKPMTKAIKERATAVMEYAVRVYEPIEARQAMEFKVISVQAISANVFKMNFKCTRIINGEDAGFHETVNYFHFETINNKLIAEPDYNFSNMEALFR